jgi:hypothetical protein
MKPILYNIKSQAFNNKMKSFICEQKRIFEAFLALELL